MNVSINAMEDEIQEVPTSTIADGAEELRDPRVYELGYLLLPTMGDALVPEQVAVFKKMINDNGGKEIAEGRPEIIELAYTMEKIIDNIKHSFNTAYFGWIKFDVAPEKIDTIAVGVNKESQVLRSLLFKTVRESTLPVKRPLFNPSHKSESDGVKETESDQVKEVASQKSPIAGEELDKQIDELVTPEI